MKDLLPQPHGGALKPAWNSGTGAAANRSPMRRLRREGFTLLAEATPKAIAVLIGLLDSADERVAAVASAQVLDRVLGKPNDTPQCQDDGGGAHDLSHLTEEERMELGAALATVHRLTQRRDGEEG